MLVVQKYGGTSVGTLDRIAKVADRAVATWHEYGQCAVVVSAMGHTTDELLEMAKSISAVPDARELDALLATGEQVSAALLAMAIQVRGVAAKSFAGWQAGIYTEKVHGAARMTEIEPTLLKECLDSRAIPVIAGFQGVSESAVTTLGRGGSDTTAVAIAAALNADLCEIYTDVPGVFTTDPRVVHTAKKLDEVSYDEMLELATLGAQVLHPRAVENAKHFGIPLVVRSTFSEEEGTRIVAEAVGIEQRNVVTGIAFEKEVSRVAVLGIPLSEHGLASIFRHLATQGINVDVIVQSAISGAAVDVSFTVKQEDADRALGMVEELRDELSFGDVQCMGNLGKVSIVGAGMISNPGVAAEMFQVLAREEVFVHMVSTSEIKVSCIIDANRINDAVNALHEEFLQ